MEDKKIVQLYMVRDEKAIHLTAEKYGSRLRAISYGITRDIETSEKCENDTYLETWNRVPPNFRFQARYKLCYLHSEEINAELLSDNHYGILCIKYGNFYVSIEGPVLLTPSEVIDLINHISR